jgi:hemerythrin-like domain-containing protein
MKCTELLIREHKIILRALDVLDHMAERVDQKQPVDTQDLEAILRFLRAFADDHHQAKEESALFPELRRTSAANEPALRQMLLEHDRERSLVEGLEDSLRTKKGSEFVQFAFRLTGLIRNHIYKEDNILFEIVDRSLSADQDDRVTTELNQFKTNIDWLDELRALEWTYLRKVS